VSLQGREKHGEKGNKRDTDEIAHQVAVDGLRRMRHVDDALSFFKVGLRIEVEQRRKISSNSPRSAKQRGTHLLHDVGQTGGVVEVEVSDEDGVDGGPVEFVEERKSGHARKRRMNTGIADYCSSLVLDDAARSTDLYEQVEGRKGSASGTGRVQEEERKRTS
jgi:hypothetical protein